VGPGEPWERIPADPGMDFYLKIPAGKDPGNLRVHPCPALDKGKLVYLARDVEKKCASLGDVLIHAQSLRSLGKVLIDVGQRQEAMVHLGHAKVMLKALGNPINLARIYHVIADVHYQEQRLPEALEAIQEAWKWAESSASLSDQAYISLDFSEILFSANRDTEAWKYIEIALTMASIIGNRHQVAFALEYMGYGYLRRGDYQNAYGAYEVAAENYLGTISDSQEGICKENMARVKQKLGNTDLVIGFYRPGLDVDKSLYYPLVQASVNDIIDMSNSGF
jgi:tetratricopeptide (TPR) repeat protein